MSKRQFTTPLLFLWMVLAACHHLHGQSFSAIIKDVDGYTNVRKDSSIKSEIVEKFIDGEVFEYSGDDWYQQKSWIYVGIDRTNNKDKCKYLSVYNTWGYMHKSRVLPMDQLPNNFERKVTDTRAELIGQNIQAQIDIRLLTQEEIRTLSEDGCIWGTDLGNPINVISNVQLTINGKIVSLPTEEYGDLYHATLSKSYLKTYKDLTFIVMSNSDGAGFYEVTWVFKDGVYQRRYINTGP